MTRAGSGSGGQKPIQVLGRYALYEKIAAGGMASVHLARQVGAVGFSRTVAIKRLHPHYAGDPEFVSMFLDEARVAARIRHPNVVPTVDVVAADGELFLVMEYVQGESLNRLLGGVVAAKTFAPPRVVSAIMVDVLHGLHAAHEAKSEGGESLGIVHRDVSPHNVLVGVDGTARVLDFGIAKAVSRLQTTREGQLKGKLAYMSPEQVLGLSVDLRTDVYAAAVVLWEALTAKRLYVGDSEAELMARVHAAEVEPPSSRMHAGALAELPPDTRKALDAVVMKGLAREANERWQTARAMATALEECLPPAPRAQVADWVEGMAQSALEQRASSLAQIESDISLTPTPPPQALLDAIKSVPPERGSTPSVAEPALVAGVERDSMTRRDGPSTAPNMALPRTAGGAKGFPWKWTAIGLGVLLVGGAAAATLLAGRTSAQPPASTTVARDAAAPRAMTDWPSPASANGDALAAYRAGLQAERDGSFAAAFASFDRATALDPGLAAGHLRKAVADSVSGYDEMATREAFSKAVQLRGALTERDQALVDAFEPYLQRDPSEVAEAEKRMALVASRYPQDAEVVFYAAFLLYLRGELAPARAGFDRAAALDPRFAMALAYDGGAAAYLGDFEAARRTLDRCVTVSPTATDCIWFRTILEEQRGDCAAEEADAKLWIARDSNDSYGYQILGQALLAQGRSVEAARASLVQKWSRLPPATRAWREAIDRARLDFLAGSFDHGQETLRGLLESSDATDTLSHARPAMILVASYRETGNLDRARRTADAFLKQHEVWVAPHLVDDGTISDEAVPTMLAAMRDSGAMTAADFEAKRAQWLDAWRARTSGAYTSYLWVYAYAALVETPADAAAALAALPAYAGIPRFNPQSVASGFIGRTYLLAGQVDEAIGWLKQATASCVVLMEPVDHTRAFLDLGTAFEEKGDKAGACEAYGVVLARWGSATPRSRSGQAARARTQALACGK